MTDVKKSPEELAQDEKVRRFEEIRKKKSAELEKVIRFLLDTI